MNLNKYAILVLMTLIGLFGAAIFLLVEKDIALSYSIVLNLVIAFYLLSRYSPDTTRIKLSFIYLLGFSLFICGRFFANILGVDETFCFDFGYKYCLNQNETLYSFLLINSSLLFFLLGYLSTSVRKENFKIKASYFNINILYFYLLLGVLAGVYTSFGTIESIFKAITSGYLSLYSGQVDEYSSPVDLIVMVFFNATVALGFSFKEKINIKLFYFILFIFLFNLIVSVFSGSRANFVSALLVILWFMLGEKKVGFKNIIITTLLILSVFLTNSIASISGARGASDDSSGFYTKVVEEIFYNQGITMMVFNMGVLENDYPLLAYIKTIIPGSQIIYSWFSPVFQYDLSFSQHLMYKLSPSLFYEGYGLAWSLLGDFYAFSFGLIFLFFFYNYIWGKLVYFVSSGYGVNFFYNGLYFCFLISIFILSRFSISSFLVLIIFYFLMHKSIKFKWGKV
ncbi:hypothetical protein F889_03620 [Acinetobacter colistiniresistens]|uniref:Oligosaccharide repeat unit polymerase n=1 Tax=Acinetobacter colistiniresistens TaxID=280145 RepID=N9QQG1_9GAMM|nr:O-antigen polysaccharide polymerase Wzy [Acinetobacter colistiniresistens]ENX32301.1 hypothetical protein F889_03620 [Acinetobacter colistiniresistens]